MRIASLLGRLVVVVVAAFVVVGAAYGGLYLDFLRRSLAQTTSLDVPRTAVVVTGDSQRIRFALDAMDAGRFDRLYVVGEGIDAGRFAVQFGLSEKLRRALEAGHIVISSESTSTLENGIEARCLLRQQAQVSEITLITSQYHMPRTSLVFDRALPANIDIVRLPSDAAKDNRIPPVRQIEWKKFLGSWVITLAPQSFWVSGSIKPCS